MTAVQVNFISRTQTVYNCRLIVHRHTLSDQKQAILSILKVRFRRIAAHRKSV